MAKYGDAWRRHITVEFRNGDVGFSGGKVSLSKDKQRQGKVKHGLAKAMYTAVKFSEGKVKHSRVMLVLQRLTTVKIGGGIVKQLRSTCSDGEAERGQTK